jgi:hypothetical protein
MRESVPSNARSFDQSSPGERANVKDEDPRFVHRFQRKAMSIVHL